VAENLARELISSGVHFGHTSSRWNPKMKPFIFSKRGKIHIIDVKKTLAGILIAKKMLSEIAASGKEVVFVGTKRQAQDSVESAARKCKMHYVSERWPGGMLTNFKTIRRRLERLEELEEMQQNGMLDKESKKQASRLNREMRKIRINLNGVRDLSGLPGALVIVDVGKEYIAVNEAKKLGIPTVGIIDTNSDPDNIDVAIPANDDSIGAIELILNELADAVNLGRTMTKATSPEAQRRRQGRSRRSPLARATEGTGEPVVRESEKEKSQEAQPAQISQEQQEKASENQNQQ